MLTTKITNLKLAKAAFNQSSDWHYIRVTLAKGRLHGAINQREKQNSLNSIDIKAKGKYDNAVRPARDKKLKMITNLYRRPGSVPAVSNPGSVPAQPFMICKFIASIVQNVI